MTRVQKERFFNEEDYVRMKDFYILDNKKMELAPDDMYILHPLPRVNEIATEVDNDPKSCLFQTGTVRCLRPYGTDTYTFGTLKFRRKITMVKNTLTVGRIEEGFVLDHIQAGRKHGYL